MNLNTMALSATLHCLTGCAIGEVLGMVIGVHLGWGNLQTVALAVGLAFLFGYLLSSLPLLRAGMPAGQAFKLVLAADTLSILTMEIVDNLVMLGIPGAMDRGIGEPLFWGSLSLALFVAFWAAYPVNLYLLKKNKGHALTHQHMHHHSRHH
jgi:hypothetical protein